MATYSGSFGRWWEVKESEGDGDAKEVSGTPTLQGLMTIGDQRFVAIPQSSSEENLSQAWTSSPDYTPRFTASLHQELAQKGLEGENYLILTPTDPDKSVVIGLIVSTHLRRRSGRGRVLLLADTVESTQGWVKQMQESAPESRVSLCSSTAEGSTDAAVHGSLADSEVVVCTPEKLLDSLQEKRMTFDDVTLLVLDKFHLSQRSAHFTEVLQSYLAQKLKEGDLTICQVVGVASFKEAASCFKPEVESTMKHLLSLCAIADAVYGIKVSSRVFLDPVEKPVFAFEVCYQRDKYEPFIKRISEEMSKLEQKVDLRCPFKKWSEEYNSLLVQKREFLVSDANIEDRNQLTVLDMLVCYSKTLRVYMDARFEDAFAYLLTHLFTDPADRLQEQLAHGLEEVKAELSRQSKVNNPILIKLEEIVLQEILENPDLTAILIAQNEQQASCFQAWLSGLSDVDDLSVNPFLLVLSDKFELDTEKHEAILEGVEAFEQGAYNVLVTTSVIAESVSLRSCNVIIRLQSVSNELAAKLMRDSPLYKPPPRDSMGFTILSSQQKASLDDLRQEESEAILRQAVRLLPGGKPLREQVLEKQKKITRVFAMRLQHSLTGGQRKKRPESSEIVLEIKCKVCKSLAVRGSDIYVVEEGTQCVVPDKDKLNDRITLKPHLPPKHMIGSLVETQRIHCAKCNTEWGALCYWPLKGFEFHVLRCKSFVFEMNGTQHTVRRWLDAPFTIPPLSAHPDYPMDSSDSGTQSDEECSD